MAAVAGASAKMTEDDGDMAADEVVEELQAEEKKLGIAQRIGDIMHLLRLPESEVPADEKEEKRKELLEIIKERGMAPLWEKYGSDLGLPDGGEQLKTIKDSNNEKVKELEAKIEDAKENYGDAEVFEGMKDLAEHVARTGDVDAAVAAYDAIPTKLCSTGQRVDLEMGKTLLHFMVGDARAARATLTRAQELNEKGGDWDRRNRMQVYEAAYAMLARDFETAAKLLLESVATYTCYEMFDYRRFVFFTVITALLTQDRPVLKRQVVDSPDVRTVLGELGPVKPLLHSFHECHFDRFMAALVAVHPLILRDRFLRVHASHMVRVLRVRAYRQFLGAYKTVTVEGMAKAFGVGVDFLDRELSGCIAAGKLSAKIDKVAGVVEVTRPDAKSALYGELLKSGDALINKMQRLTRFVNV